jgi:uncharacterized cupredoxin-like copper-binding protein
VEELVTFLTASSDVSFTYDPNSGHEAAADPEATPYVVHGWRDPNYEPAPGSTPVPACWRPYTNPAFATTGGAPASAAPIGSPGTTDSPRQIAVDLTGSLTITDPDGTKLESITVKAGETVEFQVTNTAGFGHNFWIGPEEELSTTTGNLTDAPGVPEFADGTQTFTWTVPDGATGLQFACTVPGHYGTMHGDIIIQE